jgi:hypothetical protein
MDEMFISIHILYMLHILSGIYRLKIAYVMGMEETHHQDNHLKMVMSYDHKINLANDIPKRRHDYM